MFNPAQSNAWPGLTTLQQLDQLRAQGFQAQAWTYFQQSYHQQPEAYLRYGLLHFSAQLLPLLRQASAPHLKIQAALIVIEWGQDELFESLMRAAFQSSALTDLIAWRFHQIAYLLQPSPSRAYSQQRLQRFKQILEQAPLATEPLIRADYQNLKPYLAIWMHLGSLLYESVAVRAYRELFARLFCSWLPRPPFQYAPALVTAVRPRILMVLDSNTATAFFLSQWILEWPQQKAELLLYYLQPATLADTLKSARPDLSHQLLPLDFAEMLKTLAEAQADLIYFSEVHTHRQEQSFLAAHRLAPVQITSLLSGATTGFQTMDYFLSCDYLEQEHGQSEYTERLITFAEIPGYCRLPDFKPHRSQRIDWGLPEQARLYMCLQTYWKLHPDFDALLIAILKSDPQAHLVLQCRPHSDDSPFHMQRLEARLFKQAPELEGRLSWLTGVDQERFFGIAALANILLDPLYMGGGTTSYELLAQGLPIITWPTAKPLSRITAACYLRMGLTDCIANSAEDYVRLALDFAQDRQKHEAFSQRLLQHKDALFQQADLLEKMSSCLQQLARTPLAGK